MYTQKKNYILQLKVSRFHDHQASGLPDDRENVKLLVAKCSFLLCIHPRIKKYIKSVQQTPVLKNHLFKFEAQRFLHKR